MLSTFRYDTSFHHEKIFSSRKLLKRGASNWRAFSNVVGFFVGEHIKLVQDMISQKRNYREELHSGMTKCESRFLIATENRTNIANKYYRDNLAWNKAIEFAEIQTKVLQKLYISESLRGRQILQQTTSLQNIDEYEKHIRMGTEQQAKLQQIHVKFIERSEYHNQLRESRPLLMASLSKKLQVSKMEEQEASAEFHKAKEDYDKIIKDLNKLTRHSDSIVTPASYPSDVSLFTRIGLKLGRLVNQITEALVINIKMN